jgi:hypothetical protein
MKQKINKFLLWVIGFSILITGVTLMLAWWSDLIILFKGGSGLFLALSGLGVLYATRKL